MNAGEYTTSTHFLLNVSCELIKTEGNDYGHLKTGGTNQQGQQTMLSPVKFHSKKNNIFFIFPPHLF